MDSFKHCEDRIEADDYSLVKFIDDRNKLNIF